MQGLRPAVVALIASAGLSLTIVALWSEETITYKMADIDLIAVTILVLSLFILRKWKTNPIYVMAGAGILGLCFYSFL